MDKQKIILPVIVILVFAVIVFFGIRGLSEPEQPPSQQEGEGALAPRWEDPGEPAQSPPIEDAEVPAGAVKIGMSAVGIVPASFEVKKGQEVILTVASQDEWTHIFRFKEDVLKEVAVGVGPGQTRMVTFYAPNRAGEYEFFCDVPGHESRGEKGRMLVK